MSPKRGRAAPAAERVDPISLEIHWSRLVSLVDEAAATFRRTSFSTLVREANDFALVLTDADGRSIAQSSASIPSFIGTLPATVKHFLAGYPAPTLREGDFLVTNDPWLGTGHLNDVSGAMPVYHAAELVGFAAIVSHVPDIGGLVWGPGARDVYEEGLQIPPLKLLRAGEPDASLVALIERNVRVPEQTMGDLWGMAAACRTMAAGVCRLLDDSRVSLAGLGRELRRRSEAAMRAAIRELPDGEYRNVVQHDGFERPITVDCKLRVRGSAIRIDYSGSSAQVPRGVNVVPAYTFAYSCYAVKCALEPRVPNNEGSFEPIRTWAPEGSVLNPCYPAATVGRALVGHMLVPAVMGALAEVAPDRVWAEGSPNCSFSLTGERGGQPFSVLNFLNGGQGASSERDGHSVLSFPSNLGNNPLEVAEHLQPIVVGERSIRRGSGGAGRKRGGNGQTFGFTYVGDRPASIAFMLTRMRIAARGLAGGGKGKRARVEINGERVDYTRHYTLRKGDRVVVHTAGGGGFGARGPGRGRKGD